MSLAFFPSRRFVLVSIASLAIAFPSVPASGIEQVESSIDFIDSDAFSVALLQARAAGTAGAWNTTATVSRSEYDLDFQPASFDLFGEETNIRESATVLNLSANRQIGERLTLDLGTGYRDGFPNFRSVWLDTYFDQHFSPLEGVPGRELYENFQPRAFSASSTLKWEYLPASGIASVSVSRIQDEVSPGYEIDFDGIRRSSLVLATTSVALGTENVLTERLRSRFVVSATETSERSTRYAVEYALNAAIGQRFIWRNKIGGTTENPQFDAHYFESAFEAELSSAVSLYVDARRYEDTGEIENSLLFTTAAPGMTAETIGIGLRVKGENWNARVYLASKKSNYDPTNLDIDFFQNLYRDRGWTLFQLAAGKDF